MRPFPIFFGSCLALHISARSIGLNTDFFPKKKLDQEIYIYIFFKKTYNIKKKNTLKHAQVASSAPSPRLAALTRPPVTSAFFFKYTDIYIFFQNNISEYFFPPHLDGMRFS